MAVTRTGQSILAVLTVLLMFPWAATARPEHPLNEDNQRARTSRVQRITRSDGDEMSQEPNAPQVKSARFSRDGQEVLQLATDETIRLQHPYLGPEHLLIGMIREGHGPAAIVLARHGVDAERVRELAPVLQTPG